MTALLSIRPEFADAIFSGSKKFEFRKVRFRRPIDRVVVYVTQPVGQVVGEFDVAGVVSDTPERLWTTTAPVAGIDAERFFGYFEGCDVGHAIVVGDVRRYQQPVSLEECRGIRPPQSFVYVDD